jgi:hypothetical protein
MIPKPFSLPPSPVAEIFARQRYALVRGMIAPEEAHRLYRHVETVNSEGAMRLDDPQVPGTPSMYGDIELEKLLAGLGRKMEHLTGLALYPTYSYARLYRTGDVLKPHRDRPACEVSISINLGQTPDEPWPLYLRDTSEQVFAAILAPGDALLYRGMELTHWRQPYTGERMGQVFLHYVERNGQHADHKFDKREGLGLPLTRP